MRVKKGEYKFFNEPYRKEIRIESSLMKKLVGYATDSNKSVNNVINDIIESRGLGVSQREKLQETDGV